MAANLEKELKYHLDKESYARLIRVCRASVVKRDRYVNYYFDDPKLGLRRRRFGFRLRTIHGKKPKLTLKFPAKTPARLPRGFKVRHEYEEEIPVAKARALLGGKVTVLDLTASPIRQLKRYFSDDYLASLVILGSMKTHRTLATLPGKFSIEIDRCEMFGKFFYELELETDRPKAADRAVRELLKANGIAYRPVAESKLARFMKEWQKKRVASLQA